MAVISYKSCSQPSIYLWNGGCYAHRGLVGIHQFHIQSLSASSGSWVYLSAFHVLEACMDLLLTDNKKNTRWIHVETGSTTGDSFTWMALAKNTIQLNALGSKLLMKCLRKLQKTRKLCCCLLNVFRQWRSLLKIKILGINNWSYLICCYAMFLNFELSLFPSKTLTLFKEYSEINNIILLQILLYVCFACTCVLQQ